MKSQNERILELLKTGKAVTFMEAESVGIHRLAARVHDLKEAGHNIKSTPINYKGTRMACYWMKKANVPAGTFTNWRST